MQKIEDEDCVSVRAQMSKEEGFTGLSTLHRLYKLYCALRNLCHGNLSCVLVMVIIII